MVDLGTLGGESSMAIDVNDNGQIVGHSYTAGNTEVHVALWMLSFDVAAAIDRLVDQISAFGLHGGLTNALDAKLRAAAASWQRGNRAAVAGQLGAFVHLVGAQRGKALTDEQADSLIAAANAIVAAIKSGRAN
jgi:uncharacterized membrane protein